MSHATSHDQIKISSNDIVMQVDLIEEIPFLSRRRNNYLNFIEVFEEEGKGKERTIVID